MVLNRVVIQGVIALAFVVGSVSCKPKGVSTEATTESAFDPTTQSALIGLMVPNQKEAFFCSYEWQKSRTSRNSRIENSVVSLNRNAWSMSIADLNRTRKGVLSTVLSIIAGWSAGISSYAGCVAGATAGSGGVLSVPSSVGCIAVFGGVQVSSGLGTKLVLDSLLDLDKNERIFAYYKILGLNNLQIVSSKDYNKMRAELQSSGNSSTQCAKAKDLEGFIKKYANAGRQSLSPH